VYVKSFPKLHSKYLTHVADPSQANCSLRTARKRHWYVAARYKQS